MEYVRGEISVEAARAYDGEPMVSITIDPKMLVSVEDAFWLQAVALPAVLSEARGESVA